MMRRACVAAVFSALVMLPASWVGTSSAAAPPAANDSIDRLGACLAAGGEGRVLVLMDTSASLRASDPDAARVDAASHLIGELDGFADTSGSSIEVAVAQFADTFEVTMPWTELGQGTDRVLDALDGYRDRTSGFETDYWLAIDGARRHLVSGSADDDCRALVWFSDGMYDLDARTTSDEQERYDVTKPYGPDVRLTTHDAELDLERAGARDLCRPGGVGDALRIEGITTLAVGLRAGDSDADFALMNGVATGAKVGGAACGKRAPAGHFTLADGIDDLIFAFDQLADPDNLPMQTRTALCQGSPCAAGTHRFVTDDSLTAVHILGSASVPGYRASLVAPDGAALEIRPGQAIARTTPGWKATGSWVSGSTFKMQLKPGSGDGWSGEWGLTFIDPASTGKGEARSHIRLISDVEPVWLDADAARLVTGGTTALRLGLQHAGGEPVAADELRGRTELSARIEASSGLASDLASGLTSRDLARPVEVDMSEVAAGPATLVLTLSRSIGDSAIATRQLPDRSVAYRIEVAPPPDYPRVASLLDFGRGDTDEPRTALLELDGPGCAWLQSSNVQSMPEGITEVSLTSDADSAQSCTDTAIEVTLDPRTVGSGLAAGGLTVMTLPDEADAAAVPVEVNFRYEMLRPANEPLRTKIFIILLVLALVLPILLLGAIKWYTARLAGKSVSWLTAKGPVYAHTSFLDSWSPDLAEVKSRTLDGARRQLVLTPRLTVKTSARLARLTTPGRAVPHGSTAVTSAGRALPLAVQDHWVAVLDPADPIHGEVEVTFLLASGLAALDTLVMDARATMPAAVEELRGDMTKDHEAASRPARAVNGQDDEWGAPACDERRGSTRSAMEEDW